MTTIFTRANGALLALLVLIAGMAEMSDKGPVRTTAAAKSPPAKANPPPPCEFIPSFQGMSEPSCIPNAALTATLSSEKMSSWGKSIVLGAIASKVCGKHGMNKAACRADKKNMCAVADVDGRCFSTTENSLIAKTVLCPGSPYAKASLCQAKARSDCGTGASRSKPDADGCVVSDWAAFFGKSRYQMFGNTTETAIGGPLEYGACFLEGEVKARLGSDNEFNATSLGPWLNANHGNPSRPAVFKRARGNCAYTDSALKRNTYIATCASYNKITADTTKQVPALNMTNAAAVLGCAAAGCAVVPVNGTIVAGMGYGYKGLPAVYTICVDDATIIWTTRLDAAKDGALYRQHQLCYALALQRNAAACRGAALA